MVRLRSVAVRGNAPFIQAAVAHEAVGLRQTAERGEQQCYGEVRHIRVQDIGRVGHHDAAPRGGGRIDPVVADPIGGDDPKRGKHRQETVINRGLAAAGQRHDAVAVLVDDAFQVAFIGAQHVEPAADLLLDIGRERVQNEHRLVIFSHW